MSLPAPDIDSLLPAPMPEEESRRLLLFAIRRVAAFGLNDAHAAHALFIAFGRSFRRPLVLLRALMAEASRIAECRIVVAPCCAPRLTLAEAGLIASVAEARADMSAAHGRLKAMLGVPHCLGAVSSAQALAQAFEDLGRPL